VVVYSWISASEESLLKESITSGGGLAWLPSSRSMFEGENPPWAAQKSHRKKSGRSPPSVARCGRADRDARGPEEQIYIGGGPLAARRPDPLFGRHSRPACARPVHHSRPSVQDESRREDPDCSTLVAAKESRCRGGNGSERAGSFLRSFHSVARPSRWTTERETERSDVTETLRRGSARAAADQQLRHSRCGAVVSGALGRLRDGAREAASQLMTSDLDPDPGAPLALPSRSKILFIFLS
jgi:hypothetical protein